MEREKIFRGVFQVVLDYADEEFVEKCAQWGLRTYDEVERRQGDVFIEAPGGERGRWFIAAVALARIVGEFGKFGFGDYLPDEAEIDLGESNMRVGEIVGLLNEDTSEERRKILLESNFIDIQDIWEAIWEWKGYIYERLAGNDGKGDPMPIYRSLGALFEPNAMTDSGESAAFTYVSNGFQY